MILSSTMVQKGQYDVAVIGGGPSGMIAAGKAAALGARVVLLEKNKRLGNKLLLTGGGRCNITQADLDVDDFGRRGKFLYPALKNFGVRETVNFFEQEGLPLKREKKGRIFPRSDEAKDVLSTLLRYLKKKKVNVITDVSIVKVNTKVNKISSLETSTDTITARNYVLCTGGKSYPGTGSTGGGYVIAQQLGHTVITPSTALTPVKIKEDWTKRVQGISLRNVGLTIIEHGKKHNKGIGEVIFTHFGLSGPLVLNASKEIGLCLRQGPAGLALDLAPDLEFEELDRLQAEHFKNNPKKSISNSLISLPQKLIPVVIELTGVDPHKKVAEIKKEERRRIVATIKKLEFNVAGLMGFKHAMVTSGGIALTEIDPRTMQSRIIGNLYFAGEIIDLDGPTGGYNLQLCWSTGYLAGQSAAAR